MCSQLFELRFHSCAGVSTGLRTHAQTCSHTRQSPWTLSLYGIIVLIQRGTVTTINLSFQISAFSPWLNKTQRNLLDDHPTNSSFYCVQEVARAIHKPIKMADSDITDCEGNIISPLRHFKKISPVSSASVVQLPLPAAMCNPPQCTALITSTTVSYTTKTPFILTSPSPVSVTSVTSADAKPPVTGGLRGYEYVSVDDLKMIYKQAVKIKKERDLAQNQNKKLSKVLKSCQRKEKNKQLSRSPAHVTTSDIATQVDGASTIVSSLTSSWHTL
jgi:hypothetical protein